MKEKNYSSMSEISKITFEKEQAQISYTQYKFLVLIDDVQELHLTYLKRQHGEMKDELDCCK